MKPLSRGSRHTHKALARLEHLNQLDGAKDISVVGGDLDDNLEVLVHVDAKHLAHASEGLLLGKAAEVVDEPLQE